MYNTSMIVQFITDNNLFLKIAFVGPNIDKVVDYMESSTEMNGNSYVVLHYYPSILASQYRLEPMLVPQCADPLVQHDRRNPACFFNVNRLAKVVWMPVRKEAPKLYNFIQHFSFHYQEYEELFKLYNSEILNKPFAVASDIDTDVACAWLKSEESSVTGGKHRTWFEQKRNLMKLQQKPKLYIGGIFPLSGTKYNAPVLADGQLKCGYE
jgi:ABC-type proline/glycine betaine transport system substrate-binding protein